jgi:predicted Zn-dependent protease
LSVRYPAEVEGDLYTGIALVLDGDFLAAIRPLERVLTRDSIALRGAGTHCAACQGLPWLVSAYDMSDSAAGAERTARRWLRIQPTSWIAAQTLMEVLEHNGRVTEADSILRAAAPGDAAYEAVFGHRLAHRLRAGDYATADRMLAEELNRASARYQVNTFWWSALSLREQGRLTEALAAARQTRRFPGQGRRAGIAQASSVMSSDSPRVRSRAGSRSFV